MPRLGKGGGALAAIALMAAVFAQGAAAVPTPKADYQFHNSHDSSVPGAPPIADFGSGNAFATESVAGCATRVLTFPQGNGLVADTSTTIPFPLETIVLDFRLADVSGYRRLIGGVTGPSQDTGLYVHAGRLDWFESGALENEGGPVLANNVPAEVAFMQFVPMSGMYQLVGFVNGVQQFSYHSQFRVTAQPRLFKDNDPPGMTGEESAGAVSRVRFYADGLTPADVTDIYNASVLGNPSSCPAASASATGKPKATKAGGSVLIDTGIQGTCPDTGVDCNGTASVAGVGAKKSKASVLSSASFTVPSGKTQEVIFRLRKRGKKLLRERGKLKVTASVSLTGPNGKPVTVQTRGKLRYPGKRH